MTGGTTQPPPEPHEREALQEAARAARHLARELAAKVLTLLSAGHTAALTDKTGPAVHAARAELAEAIARHAQLLRELNEPAERAVLVVKAIAEEAIDDTWDATGRGARLYLQELRADLVRWTIDAYYGSDRA